MEGGAAFTGMTSCVSEQDKNINLISFDIGWYNYTNLGKQFIDEKYPSRHKLIIGDSLKTVPKFIEKCTQNYH